MPSTTNLKTLGAKEKVKLQTAFPLLKGQIEICQIENNLMDIPREAFVTNLHGMLPCRTVSLTGEGGGEYVTII